MTIRELKRKRMEKSIDNKEDWNDMIKTDQDKIIDRIVGSVDIRSILKEIDGFLYMFNTNTYQMTGFREYTITKMHKEFTEGGQTISAKEYKQIPRKWTNIFNELI